MIPSGITWSGPSIDDTEILIDVPRELVALLLQKNGFILHAGAFHLRGATMLPTWHSLRHAWQGESAFYSLYEEVRQSDVPFAEDMMGDQFLLRDGGVIRLEGETGEVEEKEGSLGRFLERVEEDIESYLNLSLTKTMEPGKLLFAYPPFCMKESAAGSKLKACPSHEVISVHADLARQIRSVPDGGQIKINWTE